MYFKKAWCLLFVCSLVSGVLFGPLATYGQEKVTLQYMNPRYPERAKKLDAELIPAFEKENPNIKIDPIYAGYAAIIEKVMAWVAAKKDPDVHWLHSEYIPELLKIGAIIPLDKYVDEEVLNRFFPSALENLRELGMIMTKTRKLYMLPGNSAGRVLWYNRDLYRQSGLDPDSPPKDWYEFLGYAMKITERAGIAGVGSNCASDTTTMNCIWASIYFSFTGHSFLTDEGKPKFNSKRGVEALKYWVDLTRKYGVTQPSPVQYTKGDIRHLLRDEKVAMWVDGYWVFSLLKEVHDFSSREKATIATAPIPVGPSGLGGNRFDISPWAISANSKHPDEAWKLVEFLTRPEWEYRFDVIFGNGPAQEAVMNMPEFSKWYWEPYTESAKAGFSYEAYKPGGMAFRNTITLYLQKAMIGEMIPKEALDAAAREVNENLERLK